MSREIRKGINEFKAANGNATFTTKDLLMYLVTRIDYLDDEIDKKLSQLPCNDHVTLLFANKDEITKLKTTNKLLAAVMAITLTIIGLAIGIANLYV